MRVPARLLLIGLAVLVGGCSSSAVAIRSATVSRDDTRLRLSLSSCNARLTLEVVESQDEVVVAFSSDPASHFGLADDSCDDLIVIQLDEPLRDRRLIDGTTGAVVDVLGPVPNEAVRWPYDRTRFGEQEYLDALGDMVACLEASDSEMEAWIHQELDWKTYHWHKEPDEDGNVEAGPALEECKLAHLSPLASEH